MLPGLENLKPGPVDMPAYEGWPATVHEFRDRRSSRGSHCAGRRPAAVGAGRAGNRQDPARAGRCGELGGATSSPRPSMPTPRRAKLFWSFDAVRRLSEAQILAAVAAAQHFGSAPHASPSTAPEIPAWLTGRLQERLFVEPGALWWAFDWKGAAEQRLGCRQVAPRLPASWVSPGHGSVVLLDEIDKADPTLPNALLEALSVGRFDGPAGAESIFKKGPEPLVVITTNVERDLPDAFMRRCVVLDLHLPLDPTELSTTLVRRGVQHSKLWGVAPPNSGVLQAAAELLIEDRERYRGQGLPPPGQAEYFDLVRAVCVLSESQESREALLSQLRPFVFDKHTVDPVGPQT